MSDKSPTIALPRVSLNTDGIEVEVDVAQLSDEYPDEAAEFDLSTLAGCIEFAEDALAYGVFDE